MSISGFNVAAVHQSDGVAEFAVAPDKYHLPLRPLLELDHPSSLRSPPPNGTSGPAVLGALVENNIIDGRQNKFRFA
jgi:hypothetical protein